MKLPLRIHFSSEMAGRIIADGIMVNAAMLITLVSRYMWLVGINGSTLSAQVLFREHMRVYVNSFWFLTIVCLVVFYFNGFYTYGRFYQDRYKVLVIAQAVNLGYLIFGFFIFILSDWIFFPRSILIPAWLVTLVFLIGSRAFLELYRTVKLPERRQTAPIVVENKRNKVLVIGGAGYIGSALLPKLLKKGCHVRLLDLLLYGTEPIQEILHHPDLEIIRADFRQIDTVVEAMRDIGAVVHLGAIVGDPACDLNEELTIEVNLMATRMLGEVAKGSGVNRFIFASTCSVYGSSDETLDEHSYLNPVSLYASSKIASERVLMQMANDHFAPVILRFGTIYGLSGRTRFDLVVNLLTAKAVVDGLITIYGGEQWRPFLHVDDAARSILMVQEAPIPLVHNQIFNVGSNEQNYTIQQVGETIQRLIPSAQITSAGTDHDRRNYRVNFNNIRRTLGFVPEWSLEQGVMQVCEAVKSGKVKDYRDVEYSNVKFLNGGDQGISGLLRSQKDWAYELLNETSPKYKEMVAS